ncbi:class I SAM-dependent methyltransferase [Dactylosporangium sp. NPDC005572]|uniref:class I SAM-dependent methyltransferase n=1 Tax=Dactylosporangium sp. NPDC005572 TaxID=3156889 RepID=UPI0033AC2A54
MDAVEYIRGLAAESLARDDAVGWWDTLYVAAGEGVTAIPWDRGGPHRLLASWAAERGLLPRAEQAAEAGGGGVAEAGAGQAAVAGGGGVAEARGGQAAVAAEAGGGGVAEAGGGQAAVAGGGGVASRGRAVVVGCGLGADAEFLAGLGWTTTAFDVSPSAVRTARERFPDSPVEYVVADLFALPEGFAGGFDLVLESMTVQALPRALRERAVAAVRSLVAPGGTLLVIAALADPAAALADPAAAVADSAAALADPAAAVADSAAAVADPAAAVADPAVPGAAGGSEGEPGPPWPLTRADVESFAGGGLVARRIERHDLDGAARWRAEFSR